MIYLGPIRNLEGFIRQQGRFLYADTYAEMITVLFKLGMPAKYICEKPVWHYVLSAGRGWQLIRLRDQGFIELKELTLLEEHEYVTTNNAKEQEEKCNIL